MELLGALFQASQSNDPGMRECAFRIFASMPSIIEKQHESAVQEVFGKGFKDDAIDVSGISSSFPTPPLISSSGSLGRHRSFWRLLPLHHQKGPA